MIRHELEKMKNITILYVEDNEATREEIVYFLENKVKKLFVAKNGEEGLLLYKENCPDLILSDIQMPKLNGIDMCKLIKDFNPNARIILLTAFSDSEYLFEAIKLGVESYNTKPINIKDLVKNIVNVAKVINLENEKNEIYNTLTQYKDVVDERSIVSKTDINGVITYINDTFEKLSGFTKDELIGNTHSLLKHEDNPSSLFKNMWETILAKNVWQDIVKIRRKNGEESILDTIIKPIIDTDGKIVEFIALRNDITDLERSKEFFQKQSIVASNDLKESIRVANAYKAAIEETNIIMYINKNRKITYVNDAFCEISGYSKDELIGKDYSFLKSFKISEDEYEKYFNSLQKYLMVEMFGKEKFPILQKMGHFFIVT